MKKKDNDSFETHKENQVVNSDILNEVVDIPFKSCHEHTLYVFSENQYDSLQVNLQFEKTCHNKQITEFFEGCHVFYDLVAIYMEIFQLV